jgi:protease-4
MRHSVNAACATAFAAVLAAAVPARAPAQVENAIERDQGLPSGMALPVVGAAAAEEPTAMETNPAGVGFVPRLALQYFHEEEITQGSDADGFWTATGLGPLGVGFAMQWIRPGEAPPARYRKTSLALTLGDKRTFSFGFQWNWWASHDPALDQLASWDVGLTIRPWRHLSIGASMRDRDARFGNVALPVRYDIGVATRFWQDAVTLSADLLANDRTVDDFYPTHVAFGATVDVPFGLALAAQVQIPIRSNAPGPSGATALVALTWNGPHVGWTGGALPIRDRTAWLIGVRASSERYRSDLPGYVGPVLDVGRELEPPTRIAFLTFGEPDPFGRLMAKLEALSADRDVAAVVLRIDDLPLGSGRIEDLRSAIGRVRQEKPVLAYLVGGGTREYWLATAASAIAAQPGSALIVNGVSTSTYFLRDGLARLGVAFEVVKRGAYKSAPEPLVRRDASPEAREATNALLDDVFGRIVSDVAAARGISEERVRALVDQGVFSTEEARDARLVDEAIWPDEVENWARRAARRAVDLARGYDPQPERRAERWGPVAVVEVIRVEGTITAGKSRGGQIGVDAIAGAESIAAQLRRAADNRAVKAIVLRVESPGGDGVASDRIWREVVRARRRKPVVASMGDLAASGGYLAAVGADEIIAEPTTLTGSIGVFALKPDLSGLLAKLSIGREAYTRGANSQIASVAKPWSDAERATVDRQIERFYALFVDRVAEGRKLPRAAVEPVAGGRVWTGRQALERRLVDRLGSLQDAIDLAKQRAGLGARDLVEVRRAERGDGDLGAMVSSAIAAAVPPDPVTRTLAAIPELRALSVVSELGTIVAMPVEWVVPEASP